MEDKKKQDDKWEKNRIAFSKAVKARGLNASLLGNFFSWNSKEHLKELKESVDGGINRAMWDWDTQARSVQSWSWDGLRTRSSFLASQFCFINCEEFMNEALEGDLSLIVNVDRSFDKERNAALYSATYEICTYDFETPPKRNQHFGVILKFWRGSLDTLRVNRILAGKSGNTSMHLEVDRYLKILEGVHISHADPKPKRTRKKTSKKKN